MRYENLMGENALCHSENSEESTTSQILHFVQALACKGRMIVEDKGRFRPSSFYSFATD